MFCQSIRGIPDGRYPVAHEGSFCLDDCLDSQQIDDKIIINDKIIIHTTEKRKDFKHD